MIVVDCREAIKKLNDTFGYVKENDRKLAVARAINHTMAKAKTQISREIRDKYALDAKTVSQALNQIKADRLTMTGKIVIRGKPISLYKFKARQTSKGVTVEVMRGKRRLIPGVFLAQLKSGHTGVMFRGKYGQGKLVRRRTRIKPNGPDLPITEIVGISLPKAATNEIILRNITKGINEMFPQRFEHELKRVVMPI